MEDVELLKTVKQFRKGILGRKSPLKMCWKVCCPLEGYLNFIGVKCILTEGEVELTDHNEGIKINHFWLTLSDGRIIDPTANQFNFNMKGREDMPAIYIGEKPDWYIIKKLINESA